MLLIDATEGVLAQDTHVAGYVDEAAAGLIVAVNKWDLVEKHADAQQEYTVVLRRELKFADWAPVVYISAKTGQRVEKLIEQALAIQAERTKRVPTPQAERRRAPRGRGASDLGAGQDVEDLLHRADRHQPPRFTCFVNDPRLVHFCYVRYLDNILRARFGFQGTPIRLEFRARAKA